MVEMKTDRVDASTLSVEHGCLGEVTISTVVNTFAIDVAELRACRLVTGNEIFRACCAAARKRGPAARISQTRVHRGVELSRVVHLPTRDDRSLRRCHGRVPARAPGDL